MEESRDLDHLHSNKNIYERQREEIDHEVSQCKGEVFYRQSCITAYITDTQYVLVLIDSCKELRFDLMT